MNRSMFNFGNDDDFDIGHDDFLSDVFCTGKVALSEEPLPKSRTASTSTTVLNNKRKTPQETAPDHNMKRFSLQRQNEESSSTQGSLQPSASAIVNIMNKSIFATPNTSPHSNSLLLNDNEDDSFLCTPTDDSFIANTDSPVLSEQFEFTASPEVDAITLLSGPTRKFPGPAGLLPVRTPGQPFCDSDAEKYITTNEQSKKINKTDSPCSQSSLIQFSQGPWQVMIQDWGFKEKSSTCLLSLVNIRLVVQRVKSQHLQTQKIPFLAVSIKNVDYSETDASGVFRDRTGEVEGAIHHQVLTTHAKHLNPGSVLLLQSIAVLSTATETNSLSSRRHILNITPSNLIALYAIPLHSDNEKVDIVKIDDVTTDKLTQKVTEWLKSPATPMTFQQVKKSDSMFSTVGSSCNTQVPINSIPTINSPVRFQPPTFISYPTTTTNHITPNHSQLMINKDALPITPNHAADRSNMMQQVKRPSTPQLIRCNLTQQTSHSNTPSTPLSRFNYLPSTPSNRPSTPCSRPNPLPSTPCSRPNHLPSTPSRLNPDTSSTLNRPNHLNSQSFLPSSMTLTPCVFNPPPLSTSFLNKPVLYTSEGNIKRTSQFIPKKPVLANNSHMSQTSVVIDNSNNITAESNADLSNSVDDLFKDIDSDSLFGDF